MIPQYSVFADSSLFLYLDNRLCSQSGFNNVSTLAYPINQTYYGYNVYSFPYNQIVSDASISGASQLTGVYVNNSLITIGQSGLSGINFDKGQVYFDPNYAPLINSVSGNYAVKEINVASADFPDISVLFKSKLNIRNKIPVQPTGLANNILTYPVVFIEDASAPSNTPWLLGGVDQTRNVFNLYFFGESSYQKANFNSLCKDMSWKYIPLIDSAAGFPFNNLGSYKNNIPYNYNTLVANRISSGKSFLVEDVEITEFGRRGILSEIENMTTDAFFSLVTITVWTARVTS
jgi:hypothetical protein